MRSCLCITIVIDDQRHLMTICSTTNVIEVSLVNGDRKTRKKFEFELGKGFLSVTRHARFCQ